MVDEAVRNAQVNIRVDQRLLRDCDLLIANYDGLGRVTRHRLLYIAMKKGIEALKRQYKIAK